MATLKNGLSRRSFLTLGGVAALGGAAALAGCAPQASSSANADAKGATDNEIGRASCRERVSSPV